MSSTNNVIGPTFGSHLLWHRLVRRRELSASLQRHSWDEQHQKHFFEMTSTWHDRDGSTATTLRHHHDSLLMLIGRDFDPCSSIWKEEASLRIMYSSHLFALRLQTPTRKKSGLESTGAVATHRLYGKSFSAICYFSCTTAGLALPERHRVIGARKQKGCCSRFTCACILHDQVLL